MEAIVMIAAILVSLLGFDLAAAGMGADSRDEIGDQHGTSPLPF